MKTRLLHIISFMFVFLYINISLFGQVAIERSKDKVVIAGVAYYIHQVKKGETAYSISKAYGITVQDLTRENPPALYGVNEGQSLRIPVGIVTDQKQPETQAVKLVHDDAKFTYHQLNAGETIYSLSKLYGVSDNDILSANPGLDITKMSIGSEIAIPKRQFQNIQQKFEDTEGNYIYHKVLAGETLYSIGKQYNITVRQLRKENRDLRFPQVGDLLRIPADKETVASRQQQVQPEQQQQQDKPDTFRVTETVEPVTTVHTGYTPVTALKGTFDVAVLLPFYLPENSSRIEIDSSKVVKGKKTYKVNQVSDEWIYPGSYDFIEMYSGVLLAADSLRNLGLNVNLHTFDIRSDTVEIQRLIQTGKLAGMDLIFGPVYSHNLVIVSDYARSLGIPVISPVPLVNNSALRNHPNLFMANASLEIAQRAIARNIAQYYDKNIIFIHTDTTDTDEDVKRFKSLIFTELKYKENFEDIKFREFRFYSRSMFNNDSINRLSHALSEQTDNIVIIASEDAPVISEVIDNVSSMSRRFSIKLFGYPVIRELDRLDQKELFDMDMIVYSPYWIDYSKKNVKAFNNDFAKIFHTMPLERSYAWQGFDLTFYFLSGMAMHGKNFLAHPDIHYPDLLESDFDFRRNSQNDGFENHKLFMIRYTKNYEVVLDDQNSLNQEK